MTRDPTNANSGSNLINMLIETVLAFFDSHGTYSLFWNRP
jgi:hypothetical protein